MTNDHPAIEVAKRQAILDFPGAYISDCRLLAVEPSRILVLVSLAVPNLIPPVTLYAVASDFASASMIDPEEGKSYGFDPRLRK